MNDLMLVSTVTAAAAAALALVMALALNYVIRAIVETHAFCRHEEWRKKILLAWRR